MTGSRITGIPRALNQSPCGLVGVRAVSLREVMFESCGLNGRQPGEGGWEGTLFREEKLPGEDATSRRRGVSERRKVGAWAWNEEEAGLEPSQGPGGSEADGSGGQFCYMFLGGTGGPRNWEAVEISVAQRKPRVVGLCIRKTVLRP